MSSAKGRQQSTKKARRKAPIAVLQLAAAEPENEPEADDILPEEMPIEDRIRAAFGQVGETDRLSVHLYKIVQGNNRPEQYVEALDASALDSVMDRVRDTCGGGDYRVRVYKNQKIRTQFDFSVYAQPKPAAPANPPESALADVLRRQNEMLERMMERLSAPAVPAAPTDRLKEISELADVLKKLSPERSAAPALDMPGMFAMVKSGIELFREFGGGGGDGDSDSLIGLVREVAKGVPWADVLGMLAAARAPAGRMIGDSYVTDTVMTTELPPPHQEAPPPPQQPASTGNPLFDALRPPLLHLVTRAERKTPPERAAEWALVTLQMDGVPDDAVAALLERPDLLAVLKMIVPAVQQHESWFALVLDQMRAMVFEPESENEDAVGRPAADSAAPPP